MVFETSEGVKAPSELHKNEGAVVTICLVGDKE